MFIISSKTILRGIEVDEVTQAGCYVICCVVEFVEFVKTERKISSEFDQ